MSNEFILLGITGGIAAYRMADVAHQLVKEGVQPVCLLTESAQRFITPLTLQTLSHFQVYTSLWATGDAPGIDHIELSAKAKLMLIAPATMNSIGKLANGLADDIVSLTAQTFAGKKLIAPAMNTRMWNNTLLQKNLNTLKEAGYQVIEPVEGELACGEEGMGKLASVEDLVKIVLKEV